MYKKEIEKMFKLSSDLCSHKYTDHNNKMIIELWGSIEKYKIAHLESFTFQFNIKQKKQFIQLAKAKAMTLRLQNRQDKIPFFLREGDK